MILVKNQEEKKKIKKIYFLYSWFWWADFHADDTYVGYYWKYGHAF